jgi:hypothetical protein
MSVSVACTKNVGVPPRDKKGAGSVFLPASGSHHSAFFTAD